MVPCKGSPIVGHSHAYSAWVVNDPSTRIPYRWNIKLDFALLLAIVIGTHGELEVELSPFLKTSLRVEAAQAFLYPRSFKNLAPSTQKHRPLWVMILICDCYLG